MNDVKLSRPHYVAPLHPFLRWLKTVALASVCVAIGVYGAIHDEGPHGVQPVAQATTIRPPDHFPTAVRFSDGGDTESALLIYDGNEERRRVLGEWRAATTGSISDVPPACPITAFSSSPSSWIGSAKWSPAVPCLILFPRELGNPSCVVSATDSPIPLSYKVMADALEIDAQGHGFDVACTWSTK